MKRLFCIILILLIPALCACTNTRAEVSEEVSEVESVLSEASDEAKDDLMQLLKEAEDEIARLKEIIADHSEVDEPDDFISDYEIRFFAVSPDGRRAVINSFGSPYGNEAYMLTKGHGFTLFEPDLPEGNAVSRLLWFDERYLLFLAEDETEPNGGEVYAFDTLKSESFPLLTCIKYGKRITEFDLTEDGLFVALTREDGTADEHNIPPLLIENALKRRDTINIGLSLEK